MIIFSLLSFVLIYKLLGSDLIFRIIKSPLIFPFIFIFTTYVISPILYYFDLSYFKFWLFAYNDHFYTLNFKVLSVFLLFLFNMLIGFRYNINNSSSLPKFQIGWASAGIAVFIAILFLIYMVKGNLFVNIFNREVADTYINEKGFGRFLLFVPVLTFAFPIFLTGFNKVSKNLYVIISLFLYVILIPFFGVTSGRGTLIFPLLMVFFVNFNFIQKWSYARIGVFAIFFSILMIGLAGIRMGDSFTGSLENSNLIFTNISDAFSRFDSTYASLSTFIIEKWDFLYGQSYFYGLFHIFPPSLFDYRGLTITPYLAKALYNDVYFDTPSGIASSIIFESYVNFGLIGTVISGLFTGFYYRLCLKLYEYGTLEYKVLAFHMSWLNPFGLAFALFFYDIFYKIIIPFIFLLFIQNLLKSKPR